MRVSSIQIGRIQDITGYGDPWSTAFFKTAIAGAIAIAHEGLAGDEQADRLSHGGPDKAVCCYPADHYATWRRELGEEECGPGWFGENFTVERQTEESVCVGDVYHVGTARVEVSQPRGPCWKLGRRWRRSDMAQLARETGRTGWYVRVLGTGHVEPGNELTLEARPYPRWTIDTVNRLAYAPEHSRRELLQIRDDLVSCPALSAAWRHRLE